MVPKGWKWKPLEVRFWEKVQRNEGACWQWTGAHGAGGYGLMQCLGRTIYAHRFSYELAHGEIPAGLVIDHLCRNRLCVNPDHLEAVTDGENVRRGHAPTMLIAKAGVCKNGHIMDEENTYYRRDKPTFRQCKACSRERQHRYRQQGREADRKLLAQGIAPPRVREGALARLLRQSVG